MMVYIYKCTFHNYSTWIGILVQRDSILRSVLFLDTNLFSLLKRSDLPAKVYCHYIPYFVFIHGHIFAKFKMLT